MHLMQVEVPRTVKQVSQLMSAVQFDWTQFPWEFLAYPLIQLQTWLPRESYPKIRLEALSQSVHWVAKSEQELQLGSHFEQVRDPSGLTTWKYPVAQTQRPLLRTLLFSVKQLVQLVAELQVLQRTGQVGQTATPAS